MARLEPRLGAKPPGTDHRFALARNWVWRAHESADQAELGRQERKRNLFQTMAASSNAAGKKVILIDDIVTTGSSLFETARALELVGAEILGFATFAETILRKIAKSASPETNWV